jgi:arsenate reductase (glutaredoxin)
LSELQILGTKKCKDTRLAERFFKERGIHKFHSVDLNEKPLARGELENIIRSIPASELINTNAKEYETLGLKYLQFNPEDKLMQIPALLKTPIVRLGKKATVGVKPEIWKNWISELKK